ncbi:sulfotransferase family protein [Devosia nitrariae]|uniref:Sulfotransferase family protein n=1 Tax=Devosia nitrariae TaxID=2071872 RepID=A0ABQ5W3C2_9HYPH|nr:sulfotransferase [Devosia nitrariae]GLQ54311.1 hypothetical protein GCM10010862_15700 [Devosia nitrariae]
MAVAALVAGLVAFIAVLEGLSVRRHVVAMLGTAQNAIGAMADPDLDDEAKEKHAQRATLLMLKNLLVLVAIGAAACLAAALFVVGGSLIGLFSLATAVGIAMSWSFILWSTVGGIALWLLLAKVGRKPGAEAKSDVGGAEVPYSPLDKALHNYAFASPARQIRLASIEDKLWDRTIAATRAERPVFVTSLARAGTTILLELLAAHKEFASATYRNMPFTMAPLLWGRVSGLFYKAGEKAERAHGDGIAVNLDSPEAFEEMIWMAFWREHYANGHIEIWTEKDRYPEYEAFLARHMKKVVAGRPGAHRYLSKNNANIARLPLILAAFPDAQVLIPVRDPVAHVASLMRQHRRFLDLHARDRFARQYMEGIGHFEFGAALRPIAFPGGPESAEGAEHADYWLGYWIAAYEHVLRTAPAAAIFVDHDALSTHPVLHLPLLAEALGLDDKAALLSALGMFRSPKAAPALPGASLDLLRRAGELHAALIERALQPMQIDRKAV